MKTILLAIWSFSSDTNNIFDAILNKTYSCGYLKIKFHVFDCGEFCFETILCLDQSEIT
jgi:hypothetical protein